MSETLIVPGGVGKVSDGYHSFDELYEHRCALFLALMASHPELSWISTLHHDGSKLGDWFITGMSLPTGDVTYHMPAHMWPRACEIGVSILERGKEWDGHTPEMVVSRINAWLP